MDLVTLRRWWPLAAVVALLALAALSATQSTPRVERVEPPIDIAPTLPEAAQRAIENVGDAPSGAAPEVSEGLPDWLGIAALAALGLVTAAVVGLLVWALVRERARRRGPPPVASTALAAQSTADDLVAALDAGLLDLSDTDGDPRRAVIACWVRLEQAAAAAGTPRRPGDTPADLVGRLLTEQQVSAELLAGFAVVYREARYATHTVDERMRADARAALQRLRADLAVGAQS